MLCDYYSRINRSEDPGVTQTERGGASLFIRRCTPSRTRPPPLSRRTRIPPGHVTPRYSNSTIVVHRVTLICARYAKQHSRPARHVQVAMARGQGYLAQWAGAPGVDDAHARKAVHSARIG